jgi:hypothetical protein
MCLSPAKVIIMPEAGTSLMNILNGLYADRVGFVEKRTILIYADDDIDLAVKCLKKWEQQGALRIIKDLDSSGEGDDCIELLSFIK